jgi:hypothetical protein
MTKEQSKNKSNNVELNKKSVEAFMNLMTPITKAENKRYRDYLLSLNKKKS